ncbi:MAG: hypothetical protein H6744_08885 [Deltaproteobacteria bacterium]|nr:hypothetical protein [Deltaproteobacteria bacterium]MCB9786794.1 hypothetical protein [Deltaproteobacteria bacterium]
MSPTPSLAVALALALATLSAPAARARTAPPTGTAWVGVRTGLAFIDSVSIDASSVESTSDPAPLFGVGAFWRTRRLDVGAFVEHIGSGRYQRLASKARIGSQIRAAAALRWRYVEQPWGGMYARLTPGLAIIRHSDTFRLDTADSVGVELADMDVRSFGFSMSFDLGLEVYVNSRVAVSAEFSLINTVTRLRRGAEDLDYNRVRGVFVVGLELRP